MIDALARSRRSSYSKILAQLDGAELARILKAHGLAPASLTDDDMRRVIIGEGEIATGPSGTEVVDAAGGKGGRFERQFAEHMREQLGFEKVKRNEWCKGSVSDRGYECDIHATDYSQIGLRVYQLGLVVVGVATLAFFMPMEFQWMRDFAAGFAVSGSADAANSGLLVLGALAAWAGWMGKRKSTKHVWVECKNRKSTIKRTDINKLVGAAEDVRALRANAKWVPDELWFASKQSAYDQDALNFAREKGVRCFVWEKGAAVERQA